MMISRGVQLSKRQLATLRRERGSAATVPWRNNWRNTANQQSPLVCSQPMPDKYLNMVQASCKGTRRCKPSGLHLSMTESLIKLSSILRKQSESVNLRPLSVQDYEVAGLQTSTLQVRLVDNRRDGGQCPLQEEGFEVRVYPRPHSFASRVRHQRRGAASEHANSGLERRVVSGLCVLGQQPIKDFPHVWPACLLLIPGCSIVRAARSLSTCCCV
mmetsp:Transcript_33729/g.82921  ORF Transcript_33729/g.82921 Transcript_33729/m.82921 type:complete len:215 (+) Transcript_33729:2539-3183(+)